MTPRFEYGITQLRNVTVSTVTDKANRANVVSVSIDGRPFKPSQRFWHSLQLRFGFTPNIFRYFRHDEVFRRISERNPNDKLRWCAEIGPAGDHLLAVTNPTNPVLPHDDLTALLGRHDAETVSYHNGVVRSHHTPRREAPFAIAGDEFRSKFVLDTPIDGFGKPALYLSLLRLICENGAIAYTPLFRSELAVGKGEDKAQFVLTRALEGFSNDEGFGALRQRFESATRSWASVNEVNRLYRLLAKLHNAHSLNRTPRQPGGDGASEIPEGSPLFRNFHQMTGDLTRIYGLANLDSLSVKRQRTLPAACRVYDLLNFTSELATHHAQPEAARQLQAALGATISTEFDLEGTADQFADWRDFFISNEFTTETLTELRS